MKLEISYGFWRPLLSLLGMGPRFSGLWVSGGELVVRMGWAFRVRTAMSNVVEISDVSRWKVWGIGVHTSLGGRYLVNGSAKGVVDLRLGEPGRGRLMGVPVRVRTIAVSLTRPDVLRSALVAA